MSARKNNTSGVTGVEWFPAANKWTARICVKGGRHYLGSYEKFENAVKARSRRKRAKGRKSLSQLSKDPA